jgi:toxoflavin biosynthesis protein ToxC
MIAHDSPISGIDAFGGRWIATAGYDNQLILWDAATKMAVARGYHDHLANQCRFSACGRFLISASSDYSARLWSVPSMRLLAVMAGHEDDVEMAVPCPDSRRIATASRDYRVGVFDFTGRCEYMFEGHTADVISVEWIRGADELLSSSDDGTVRRWNARTGQPIDIVDLGGIESDTVVATRDGVLFVGNDNGQIVSIAGGHIATVNAHDAGIKRLVFHEERHQLVSAGYDGRIRIWQSADNGELKPTHTVEVPPQVWLRSMCFSSPTTLAFGTFGSSYATYDIAGSQWDLAGVDDTHGVNAVLEFNGRQVTTGDDGHVYCEGRVQSTPGSLCNFLTEWNGIVVTGGQSGQLFDALTGEVLHQHRSPLNCAVEIRRENECQLIIGTYTGDGLVFARKAGTVTLIGEVELHANAVKGIACNGPRIFSCDATGAAAWHRTDDLSLVHRIPRAHLRVANGADSLPDGRFASVSRDRKLRIWDGTTPTVIDTPHTNSVRCIRTGRRLIATGAYSGLVCLYDIEQGAWVHCERPTCSGISSLARGEEPDTFLASSYDGSVYKIRRAQQ